MSHGQIEQDDADTLLIGAWHNPNLSQKDEQAAADVFIRMYSAGGKTNCKPDQDVYFSRWRKLVYNSCLNSTCAITGLDTGKIRLSGLSETLVRPAMEEIRTVAKAAGHALPEDVADSMLNAEPIDIYCVPSMQKDLEKGNFTEFENILGEPLREGKKLGVPMPTISMLYETLKGIQWKNMVLKGKMEVPPKKQTFANGT